MVKAMNQKSSCSANSHSTSILMMQNKLQEVISPSSSKPDEEDEYYQENEDGHLYQMGDESYSEVSLTSIPMAHREYEKILRQLESECRTHIKCEQQMKLHIECLQEKLDQTNKDVTIKEKEHNNEVTIINEEKKKLIQKIGGLEKEIGGLKQKIGSIEKQKEQVVLELKNERNNIHQKMSQLEQKLSSTLEQNKKMSQTLMQANAMGKNGNLGIHTHILSEDSNKQDNYTDIQGKKQSIEEQKIAKKSHAIARSQSVLKSHGELINTFNQYHTAISGGGSSTTQRANVMPDSKSTVKNQQMNVKQFNAKQMKQKKIMELESSTSFKSQSRKIQQATDGNPYKVDSYSKINLNPNLLDKSDIQHLGSHNSKIMNSDQYANDVKNKSMKKSMSQKKNAQYANVSSRQLITNSSIQPSANMHSMMASFV